MGGNCAVTVEEMARNESRRDAVTRLEDEHDSDFLRSNFIFAAHALYKDESVMIDGGVDMEVSLT
jgi:cobalamin biosynthesis protein CbiD